MKKQIYLLSLFIIVLSFCSCQRADIPPNQTISSTAQESDTAKSPTASVEVSTENTQTVIESSTEESLLVNISPSLTLLPLPDNEFIVNTIPIDDNTFLLIKQIYSYAEDTQLYTPEYFLEYFDIHTGDLIKKYLLETEEEEYFYDFSYFPQLQKIFYMNGMTRKLEYLDSDFNLHTTDAPDFGTHSPDGAFYAWIDKETVYYFNMMTDEISTTNILVIPEQTGSIVPTYINSIYPVTKDGVTSYIAFLSVSTAAGQPGFIAMNLLSGEVYACQSDIIIPSIFGTEFRYMEQTEEDYYNMAIGDVNADFIYFPENLNNASYYYCLNSSEFFNVTFSEETSKIQCDILHLLAAEGGRIEGTRIVCPVPDPEQWRSPNLYLTFTKLADTCYYIQLSRDDAPGSIYLLHTKDGETIDGLYSSASSKELTINMIPFIVDSKYIRDGLEDYLTDEKELASAIAAQYGFSDIKIGSECKALIGNYYAGVCNDESTIMSALNLLQEQLAFYPEGFFSQMFLSDSDSITIYLVNGLSCEDDFGISSAGGLVYQTYHFADLALDIGMAPDFLSAQTLHHEIAHLIDRTLEGKGILFEYDWNQYNPTDFYYNYSYPDYEIDNPWGQYIYWSMATSDMIYFIDTYSTTFPTEDRATIFAEAVNGYLYGTTVFIPENIQIRNKLQHYSDLIRTGFDTTGWPERTIWEQILNP
ncbi:MAG: hypothetical protein ACI4C1_04865 [Lachnospiraceae bacterium]